MTKPEDPENPWRTHHVIRLAEDSDHVDNRAYAALVESDVDKALDWLAAGQGLSLTGADYRQFALSNKWKRVYAHHIAALVRDRMVESTQETVEQARARLVASAEEIRQAAHAAGQFAPAVSALKLQADMLLPAKTQVVVNLTSALRGGDLRAVPMEELIREVQPDAVHAEP